MEELPRLLPPFRSPGPEAPPFPLLRARGTRGGQRCDDVVDAVRSRPAARGCVARERRIHAVSARTLVATTYFSSSNKAESLADGKNVLLRPCYRARAERAGVLCVPKPGYGGPFRGSCPCSRDARGGGYTRGTQPTSDAMGSTCNRLCTAWARKRQRSTSACPFKRMPQSQMRLQSVEIRCPRLHTQSGFTLPLSLNARSISSGHTTHSSDTGRHPRNRRDQ